MYAELAVYQASVRRTFHYRVPADMQVQVGQLVQVSFRTGLSQGIVLSLDEHSPVPQAKPILEILLPEPVVTPLQIALARWMADQTLSPIGACLWLMLPPGLVRRGGLLYRLSGAFEEAETGHSALLGRVIDLLAARGPLTALQIERALPKTSWREALRPLVASGVVQVAPVLPAPDARPHTVRRVRLLIPPAQAAELVNRLRKSPKQAEALDLLARHAEPLDMGDITRQTGASADSIRRLADKGYVQIEDVEQMRDPLAEKTFAHSNAPALTSAQAEAWSIIRDHMTRPDPTGQTYLLHGVTGSGKTEIYLQAIALALSQGRQAIVLVPEIALVAPTVSRFASRFPGRVAVVHSGLSEGEQYDTWRRARAGQIEIVIGARSALFTPLPDVGLVVIDEEHDDSYKQSPPLPPPYYHARETAIAMMRLNKGCAILGSATPDVTTAFRARQGEIVHLQLPSRVIVPRPETSPDGGESLPAEAVAAPLPPVTVVDMREELRDGNRSMFSRALHSALAETIERGEQAILFLNRRGTATFVLCRDCGYVAKCPNCDIPLTYHRIDDYNGRLNCHYCGHHTNPPDQCPQCGSKRIRYFGAGTGSVEESVRREFEGARVLRWDRDTAHGRGSHEAIWQQFASGDANVLVGTQMIVKGLDLPRVTLMGVVLAETALGLPDYRAGEHTFQLLTQAAGRAGRGWRGGRVIFQSYQPDHYAIKAASQHDYEAFYAQEIAYRRELRYPPYKRLVRFLFRSPQAAQAQRDAETAATALQSRIAGSGLTATQIIGPTPAHFGKIDGVYQWHLIARTTDPAALVDDLNTRAIVDVDPVDIL